MKSIPGSNNDAAKKPTLYIPDGDPRAANSLAAANAASKSNAEVKNISSRSFSLTQLSGAAASGSPISTATLPATPGNSPSVNIGPIIKGLVLPGGITNFTAVWDGDNLVFTFNCDPTASQNQYLSNFYFLFTPTGSSTQYAWSPQATQVNNSGSTQTITFTLTDNTNTFNTQVTSFSAISVSAQDGFGNRGDYVSLTTIPTYSSGLPIPVYTISAINNGYSVAWTAITNSNFYRIQIQEYVSDATSEPTGVTYTETYNGTLNPAVVIAPTLNKRWVKVRFWATSNVPGPWGAAQAVTPTAPISVNTTVPTEVTVGTVSWSGTNIVIPYTLPSTNAGVRFLVKLTAPNSQVGYFYFFPDGTTNLSQSHTISSADLYAQFGAYYSSYSGVFVSYSSVDVTSSGASFNVPARSNPLAAITPNPTIVGNINGYNVTFDFSTIPATYAEIYQKYTSSAWSSNPPDAITASYSSGGASGATTIVVNTVKDNDGNTLTSIQDGYLITGTGIPTNTYVSSVSGTAPTFTLTLSKALTTQAAGTYTMQGLVWAGVSPANIFSNLYIPTYVIVRYYDNFNNASLLSSSTTVTPIDPSLSVISNAVQIGSGGAIYVGASATSGARVVLGPSKKAPDGSQYSGIFAFDYGSASGDAASTSIITNPSAGGFTFETINAKIADWTISTNKIESTLVTGITKYTGLSASNTSYAFWAGATAAGNSDASAPFSVTPLGAVNASNLTISGGSINVGGGTFVVTSGGALTATSATITGSISATGGSFTGNVLINGGSLYSPKTSGIPSSSNAGVIFNGQGVAAYNGTGGYTTMLTTADANSSTFATTAATIGGWVVDANTIHSSANTAIIDSGVTGSAYGQPTIFLNSGTNYVGITTGTLSNTVLWAGSSFSSRDTAKFRVNGDGTLYATGATIQSNNGSNNAYYVKLDGTNDQLLIYGLPATNPGSSQTFTASITGGAIQGSYAATQTKATTPYMLTAKAGNISSSSFLSLVSPIAVQIFGTSDTVPMASFDPSGGYTTFTETGGSSLTGSSAVINTDIAFLNSSSVILGSGSGVTSGVATDSSSHVYINGFARVRNATPVGSGTGSYVRNVYVNTAAPSSSANSGFQGDLWVTY